MESVSEGVFLEERSRNRSRRGCGARIAAGPFKSRRKKLARKTKNVFNGCFRFFLRDKMTAPFRAQILPGGQSVAMRPQSEAGI
jgi:hypothetical protein